MASWAGFSEAELRRLKQQKDPLEVSERSQQPPSIKKSRQQLQREKAVQQEVKRKSQQNGAASLPLEQQLSKPRAMPAPQPALAPPREHNPGGQEKEQGLETPRDSQNVLQEDPLGLSTEQELLQQKKEVELKEKSRLDQLQLEQRLMEEKNKRKKALLSKAIAERSKRTQAETVKLKRIQKELQALDDLVSTDIGILRNRIDQACMDYNYAKKRFDKAEVEYIAAKMDLHRKTDIKEQLTEHLYTIIQQNELCKAKKLEELMHQLDVDADEENLELEIEVDQMLQQQNAENRRQASAAQTAPEKLPQTVEGNQTQQITEMKERDPSGSFLENLVENSINNCVSPLQTNDKDQEGKTTLIEAKAESVMSS
ncbi:RAB6-interacting golgin-like [Microcaecilia unicolor]|uniref:RAB6-interacting golgin n=1 Tax=Microcaecilia unicolor TaxID=1415580 RepID=A0A6P7YJZ8_9AMPH|nr:RAB6-interacting golgin-like [Microcaecilia unicolor]